MPGRQKAKPERLYPTLEQFIEGAAKDDPKKLFATTRKRLSELAKGAKGPAAQKVLAAVDRTEELLVELLNLRESLVPQAGSLPKSRRQRP